MRSCSNQLLYKAEVQPKRKKAYHVSVVVEEERVRPDSTVVVLPPSTGHFMKILDSLEQFIQSYERICIITETRHPSLEK